MFLLPLLLFCCCCLEFWFIFFGQRRWGVIVVFLQLFFPFSAPSSRPSSSLPSNTIRNTQNNINNTHATNDESTSSLLKPPHRLFTVLLSNHHHRRCSKIRSVSIERRTYRRGGRERLCPNCIGYSINRWGVWCSFEEIFEWEALVCLIIDIIIIVIGRSEWW